MNPGDPMHDLTDEVARHPEIVALRVRVERLEQRVGGVEIAIGRVEAISSRVEVKLDGLASDERDASKWRRGLIERAAAGTYALLHLMIERLTAPKALMGVTAIVALVVAGIYSLSLSWDGERFSVGGAAAAENQKRLPRIEADTGVSVRPLDDVAVPVPTM